MMAKYNTFLFLFIVSIVAMIVFIAFYVRALYGLVVYLNDFDHQHPNPLELLSRIVSPPVIISAALMAFCGLAYRILGIIFVAKSKVTKDGEKVLWIMGFIVIGFVTAIVFLAMAKRRKFVE